MTSFRFGPFRLSKDEQCLFKDDKPVLVGGRALDLLTVLVERPGELVTKEALIARVWPAVNVGEANLSVQLAVLRRLLGQDGAGLEYIRTERGRGYRFVGGVEADSKVSDAPKNAPGLPSHLNAMIGRDDEIEAVSGLLGDQRLLTITGLGGVGKTRIAIEVARRTLEAFAGGTTMVELAAESAGDAVSTRLAAALGIDLAGDKTLRRLIERLRGGRRLILFDNCEHLLAAVADLVSTLLRNCPQLVVLATSREPLAVVGEAVFALAPLGVPAVGGRTDRHAILASPAVALLIERVRKTSGTPLYSDEDLEAMAEICRRLDGIPLAIELAAARLPSLGAAALSQRLTSRLAMLTRGPRTAEPRQKTLHAMMDWSYELLNAEERVVLRRLGIFVGGWTLTAAENVICDDALVREGLLDHLSSLVDKSLVVAATDGVGVRYTMLETVREYAVHKLREAAELPALAEAHAQFFFRTFEDAFGQRPVPADDSLLRRLEQDIDNILRALDWACGPDGNPTLGIRFLGCTRHLWYWVSRRAEGAARAIQAIGLLDGSIAPADRARLLVVATRLLPQSQAEMANRLIAEAISIYRRLDEPEWLSDALIAQACVLIPAGAYEAANAGLDEVLRLVTEEQFFLRGCERMIRGSTSLVQNEPARALPFLEESCALFRAGNCAGLEAQGRMNLADLLQQAGRLDEAVVSARTAVELYRAIGDRGGIGLALHNLAGCLLEQLSLLEARRIAVEALSALRNGFEAHWPVDYIALVDFLSGAAERAAQLAGYADRQYREQGSSRQPLEQRAYDQLRSGLRQMLPAERIAVLEAEGAGWSEPEMMRKVVAADAV